MVNLVIDPIPGRIFWTDWDLRYLGCKRLFAADAGWKDPAELTRKNDFDMAWKNEAEAYRKDDLEVMLLERAKLNYEESQTTPDESQIWLRTSKVPLKDAGGNVIGILGTYEDITEKKKTEQALIESEERYRSLFQNNRAVLYMVDPDDGSIVDANPAAARYYGYNLEELKMMNISEINTMAAGEMHDAMTRARNNEGYHFFFEHRLAGGELRSVEVYGSPMVMKGKIYLHSIVHDISERKKAEEDRERLIAELQEAFSKIKTLSGMFPICAHCKKIRDDRGYWNQIESYIREHSEAEFTHGICPDCLKKLYPEMIGMDDT
jgi:PAS domain S-box-containing protein